jgi:hypothetical protein
MGTKQTLYVFDSLFLLAEVPTAKKKKKKKRKLLQKYSDF